MSKIDLDSFLLLAKEAANLAGRVLINEQLALRRVNKDISNDVKIEADLASEKIIIDHLKTKSDFSILSEEMGFISGTNKEAMWVIDPVDGSLNYSRGIPICCLSIGLWSKEQPLLGVIYDFNRLEMYTAESDAGAFLNDLSIQVSDKSPKSSAVLFSGFPVSSEMNDQSMESFKENARTYKKVRILGSAALSLAYVACGRADAYYEENIKLWDIAGGLALVKSAGGSIDLKKTDQKYCYNVFASNGKL